MLKAPWNSTAEPDDRLPPWTQSVTLYVIAVETPRGTRLDSYRHVERARAAIRGARLNGFEARFVGVRDTVEGTL